MGLGITLSQLTSHIDMTSDASVQKYVGPNQGFHHVRYTPRPLASIPHTSSLGLGRRGFLRLDATLSLIALADAYHRDTGRKMYLTSAYRSYNLQSYTMKLYGYNTNRVARPGHSEHQLGLAVDIKRATSTSSPTYRWLNRNAHKYGRHNPYQNGKRTDGYNKEPRHRRYVGVPLATTLRKKHQTLTQYFYQNRHLASRQTTPAVKPTPSVPKKPTKPITPAKPSVPAKPQKPITPTQPLVLPKPQKPIIPAKPVDTTVAISSDPSSDGDDLPGFDMY